jgi:hypothetical protein
VDRGCAARGRTDLSCRFQTRGKVARPRVTGSAATGNPGGRGELEISVCLPNALKILRGAHLHAGFHPEKRAIPVSPPKWPSKQALKGSLESMNFPRLL